MVYTASGLRLPGIYFLKAPRETPPGLSLLDIAAFVGFAERGPLDVAMPLDDLDTYRAIFGGEWPLAREPGGRTVYANLPRAVASFFANGGRRCYAVRVAGKRAREKGGTTRFRLPGVVSVSGLGSVSLASVSASSPGRWSAKLRLAARLQSTPLPSTAFKCRPPDCLVWRTGNAPEAIQTGDLLRLTFEDGSQWLLPVANVERPPGTPEQATIVIRQSWNLATDLLASPALHVEEVHRLTLDGTQALDVGGQVLSGDPAVVLDLSGMDVDQIGNGDVLRLALSDGLNYLFIAKKRRLEATTGSPPDQCLRVDSPIPLRLPSGMLPGGKVSRIERLRFDLLLRTEEEQLPTLTDLAFNAKHPRFWGESVLLESSVLYRKSSGEAGLAGAQAAQAAKLFRELMRDKRIEPFQNGDLGIAALAGLLAQPDDDVALTYLPLGMPTMLADDAFVGPDEDNVGDGDLDTFDPAMFVDNYLVPDPLNPAAGESARTLMAAAFDRHYIQNKRLYGMHSLLFIDELALLSVPDAVHRRWECIESEEPVQHPEVLPGPSPPPPCPPPTVFVDCQPLAEETSTGTIPTGECATQPRLPVLEPEEEYQSNGLLAIQQAAINFCQARNDAVGILTLPFHFEKRQCVEWHEALCQKLGLPRRRVVLDEARDIADLSYAAVYHPWLLVADESAPEKLRPVPCDGAVCGMIAARERERQVWVAPANVPLRGVLGLSPPFATADWAELFDLGFNLVRPEPADFRTMSAHTLSGERALLQLSVRRLMILLRKMAAERGMDFVFESNHERFREGVRVMLENMLHFMFDHGAFSGATPQQAYQVVTNSSVNTPQDIEQGRFIVEIKIAPSQPMEFMTVVLTRISEGLLLATEV